MFPRHLHYISSFCSSVLPFMIILLELHYISFCVAGLTAMPYSGLGPFHASLSLCHAGQSTGQFVERVCQSLKPGLLRPIAIATKCANSLELEVRLYVESKSLIDSVLLSSFRRSSDLVDSWGATTVQVPCRLTRWHEVISALLAQCDRRKLSQ